MVSICRLCASLKKTECLTFIRDNSHDLCQKLAKCCQLSIDLKDVLPKGVCPDCVRCLNVSFEFYEKVHESQQSLQKLLNVEPNSKADDAVASDVAISEDHDALALMAAAASTGNDETSQEETASLQEVRDTLAATDSDSNHAKQDFREIICVKDEKATYLILNAEAAEASKSGDIADENDTDDGTINPNNFFSSSTYGIEFIDDDGEEIAYDQTQYQIIEEVEDGEEASIEEQIQYLADHTEENAHVDEEKSTDCTTQPSRELTINTWLEYPWKCVKCSEVFNSAKDLIRHTEIVHELSMKDIKWVCADCLKDFTRYYALVNHVRQRHRSNLGLVCDVCNETQEDFKSLEEHRFQTHQKEDLLIMLMCRQCGKGFHTSNSLQIHSKCHLPDDVRLKYSCVKCDKRFGTLSNLKFHQKIHAGTRDFICDQCGKNFAQRANLEEHLVTHIDSTPYECSLCHQFFKTPERLARHKLRHTDEKPFSCKECKKTFRTKDAMTTHLRIHTGEMPFACEFCFKPFRFRSTLMTHHNVHTGVRPYACLECNHHFTNWPNYNKHMKRRHGVDVSSKNPRGKKPSKPAKPLVKPLKKPKKPLTGAATTADSHFIVKLKADQDILVENADGNDVDADGEEDEENENEDIATEDESEEDINITVAKQEDEKPGDNYEDAI